jgi:hypothetical protein
LPLEIKPIREPEDRIELRTTTIPIRSNLQDDAHHAIDIAA